MKIILWSAHYLPNLGGVERYTYHIAKELIKRGNEVVVITSNIKKITTFEEEENISIIRFDVFSLLDGRFPIVKFNKKNKSIIKKLKSEKFDYSIINTRFYIHSLVGAIFSKKYVKKSILIDHGTGHFTVNNYIFDKLGELYEHLITYFVKRNLKFFYGVSEACNKWLKHFNINANGVLYNSVDQNILVDKDYDIKKVYNISENSIVVTFTGRLIKEKGVAKLIAAFDKISENNKNIVLFIAGDGELYDEIIQNNKNPLIYITGRLEHSKIMKLLENTDIFILPTDFPEGLPTSILEAGLKRCAVIASSRGGSSEVILNEEYGIILKENSIDEIIIALEKLISSKELREKISRNLHEHVEKVFAWEKTTQKILEEFDKI